MPNIMILGFNHLESTKMKNTIDKIMQQLELDDDAVTSIVENVHVVSCNGEQRRMPYLRICSTDKDEIKRIVEAFKKAKIKADVECLFIEDFIPAEEMC